jgi:hypothetical protein
MAAAPCRSARLLHGMCTEDVAVCLPQGAKEVDTRRSATRDQAALVQNEVADLEDGRRAFDEARRAAEMHVRVCHH